MAHATSPMFRRLMAGGPPKSGRHYLLKAPPRQSFYHSGLSSETLYILFKVPCITYVHHHYRTSRYLTTRFHGLTPWHAQCLWLPGYHGKPTPFCFHWLCCFTYQVQLVYSQNDLCQAFTL